MKIFVLREEKQAKCYKSTMGIWKERRNTRMKTHLRILNRMIYGKKFKANNLSKKIQDGKKEEEKKHWEKGKEKRGRRSGIGGRTWKRVEKLGREMRKLFLGKGRFKIGFWFASIFSAFYLSLSSVRQRYLL